MGKVGNLGQGQQGQADQVRHQATAGDLADQLAAYIAALADQHPQVVFVVL